MDELRKWRDEAAERLKNGGPYKPLHGPPWNPPSSTQDYDEPIRVIRHVDVDHISFGFDSATYDLTVTVEGQIIDGEWKFRQWKADITDDPSIIEGEVIRMELTDGK